MNYLQKRAYLTNQALDILFSESGLCKTAAKATGRTEAEKAEIERLKRLRNRGMWYPLLTGTAAGALTGAGVGGALGLGGIGLANYMASGTGDRLSYMGSLVPAAGGALAGAPIGALLHLGHQYYQQRRAIDRLNQLGVPDNEIY